MITLAAELAIKSGDPTTSAGSKIGVVPIIFISIGCAIALSLFLTMCGLCDCLFGRRNNEEERKYIIMSSDPKKPIGRFSIEPVQHDIERISGSPIPSKRISNRESILSGSSVGLDSTLHETADVFFLGENYNLGKIHFIISYNYALKHLTVKIIEAIDLKAMDLNGKSDPYVKAVILPDKQNKVHTKIKERKLNPKWNEVFVFESFPSGNLHDRTLYLKVLDFDRFSKDDSIGEVHFPLEHLYRVNVEETSLDLWKHLLPCAGTKVISGEILISLCYNIQTSRLTITLLKAKELGHLDCSAVMDVFCTIKLVGPDGKTIEKKVTNTKEKTRYPVWDEGFIFNIEPQKVRELALDIAVYRKTFLHRERLGRIHLASRSNPEEAQHWTAMMNTPRQTIVQWHALKS